MKRFYFFSKFESNDCVIRRFTGTFPSSTRISGKFIFFKLPLVQCYFQEKSIFLQHCIGNQNFLRNLF